MLVKKNLSLYQVINYTWKVDISMVLFCSIIYLVDQYVMTKFVLPIAYPSLMGTAIAFFIGFNNNQAYGRWWEARIIWGGLVNDSRSWARNLVAYNKDQTLAKKMIRRHIAFVYALSSSLRKDDANTSYAAYLTQDDLNLLNPNYHRANEILQLQAHDLNKLRQTCAIDDFVFASLNNLLQNFCDGLGKSERINNTIYPITYVYFTQLFIWLFIALITMSTSSLIGISSIILGWLMGFVFNAIHFNAIHFNGMSLMNPFSHNPAGIPINSITRTIEINLLQTLKSSTIPEPLGIINNEYIM